VGASVIITGASFGATQGSSTVAFNGVSATPTSWSDTSITAPVPAGATTGSVVVTVGGSSSYGVIFAVATSNLTLTGSLSTARMFQTSTLLDNGKVLIAGGVNGFTWIPVPSAELYDPASATFTSTGSLNTGRMFNTGTLLNNGQVLIVGGADSNWNNIGTTELYDPGAGAFSFTGNLNTPRDSQTATLLSNGKVLIVGGVSSNGLWITALAANSEIYDPAAGTFSSTGSLSTARDCHTATLLNNGQVLIVGGNDVYGFALASAELYNPATGTFTSTGSLNYGRAVHTASLLNNGMVLIAGGYDTYGNAVASAELYNPATGTFTVTGSMNTPRYDMGESTLLSNGMVLIAGGQDTNGNTLASVELYDPAAGTFSVTGGMNSTRQSLMTTLLPNGQVLISAGMDYYANVLASAELYQPSTLTPPGLVSIAISPQNPSIALGASQQMVATGTFSDNSTQTLTSAIWSSSAPSIATISNDASNYGNALGVAQGTSTISACAGSICGSTTLTVAPPPPSITSLSPTSGSVGTAVTITGTNFGSSQGSSTVTFSGVAATPTSWSGTSITVPVPTGTTSGNVLVTVSGNSSNAVWFTVLWMWANGYSYQRAITISHANVPNTDQTNFPILFSGTYSYLASTSNAGNVTSANGYDIIFTSDPAGQNKLNFEQESYNPATGAVNYWVQIPTLSHSQDTVIYMFYGNSAVTTDQSNKTGVWDSSYVGVWHLHNGTTLSGADSTSNGNTLTNNGSVAAAAGFIDGAASFNGASAYLSHANSGQFDSNTWTWDGWIKPTWASGAPTANPCIFGLRDPGGTRMSLHLTSNYSAIQSWNGSDVISWTPTIAQNNWYHAAFTYNNGALALYVNGSLVSSQSQTQGSATGRQFDIGYSTNSTEYWAGLIDEARFSSTARSADWIAAEYKNQSSPSAFYGIGGANSLSIYTLSPTYGTPGTTVTIAGAFFGSTQGASTVTFNGTTATPSSWSDTSITVPVPAGATTGNVVVTVDAIASNGMPFTVTSPSVTNLTPSLGTTGTPVTIAGTYFGSTQGSSTVTFNGTAATPTSWSATSITVPVPAGATTGNVVVTVNGFASNGVLFTVASPYTSGYLYRQTIDLNHAKVANTDQTNFPVLISGVFSNLATVANGGFVQNSNGYDIIFSQDPEGATKLDHEVESYDPVTGTANFWVRIPTLSHTVDTVVYMFYGNSAVTTDQSNKTGVWDSNYVGVWHLPNGTTLSGADSTSNGNTLTNNGSVAAAAGFIDGAASFNGASAYLSHANSGQFDSNTWTWDGWIKPTWASGAPTADPCIFGLRDPGGTRISLHLNLNYSGIAAWNGSDVVSWTSGMSQNNWYHAAFTYNNGALALYVNGSLVSSQSQTQGSATGRQFDIGYSTNSTEYWMGLIDEARFSSTARSGDWIATEYANQLSPSTFYAVEGPVTGDSAPTIQLLAPAVGLPGTAIAILGGGFQPTQGGSTVTFNGVAATPTSWNDGSILVPVPTGATTGNVVVTVNGIVSNGMPFTVPPPGIASLSPNYGLPGTVVTITGTYFGSTQGSSTLMFNSTPATPTSWSNTSIVVPVPAGATTGDVVVTVDGVSSNGVTFTVPPPSITSLTPSSGPLGTVVAITGTYFGAAQGNSTVTFNGTALTPINWSNTDITIRIPVGASTGNVVITVDGTASNGADFTVLPDTGTTTLSDSMARITVYGYQNLDGRNFVGSIAGTGCASCGGRGNSLFTYDALGNVLSSTDALNNTTTYTYDSMGNVLTRTQYLASNTPLTWSYTYNSFQEVLTATDPLGNVTTNVYDANGNLLSTTTPPPSGTGSGLTTSFQYNSLGELTQVTDPKGNAMHLAYTPAGLVASVTDAQSNATTFTYDGRGNRLTSVDALNNTTTYTYDAMNRLTMITAPDQSTTQFAYDYRGRRISVTDANGKVTQYQYDDADRLVAVTDAASNLTVYGYDTENNMVGITDAASHQTAFAYDALGRVTQVTFPSTLRERYTYDAVNNLLSKTDRKNQTIQYGYDALYRLTSKNYPDQTAVNYTYDPLSRLTQVTDPTGTYSFTYDNLGRLMGTGTQYSFLTEALTNSYTYDAASNRTSFTSSESGMTNYSYDSLNRLTSLTDPNTGQFGFGYDALGRRTSLTRPNGVGTSYSYDTLSRLLSVLHGGGALPGSTGYTYDAAGNRTSKTAVQEASPNPVSVTSAYSYDPIYELTQAVVGGTLAESYSYDAVGNRLSSAGPTSYNYNTSNQLTSTSAAAYTYDSNGNTLSKTDSTGTTYYTWDFENRLTSVTLPGTGGTVNFIYDPFGRRIEKSGPAGTTVYAYDGDNVVEGLGGGGNLLAHYTQGAGIDEPLAMTGTRGTYFFETDGLSSITSLTDGIGQLASSYVYDSFGNLTTSTGTIANPFQYTAREFDSETSLYYYRARYFDPSAGRFLSEDPIGLQAGVNFYSYVGNSPIDLVDPSGSYARLNPNSHCAEVFSKALKIGVCGKDFAGSFNKAAATIPIYTVRSPASPASKLTEDQVTGNGVTDTLADHFTNDKGSIAYNPWGGPRHAIALGPLYFAQPYSTRVATLIHEEFHAVTGLDDPAIFTLLVPYGLPDKEYRGAIVGPRPTHEFTVWIENDCRKKEVH
jgi:RHS repeat-associated protein